MLIRIGVPLIRSVVFTLINQTSTDVPVLVNTWGVVILPISTDLFPGHSTLFVFCGYWPGSICKLVELKSVDTSYMWDGLKGTWRYQIYTIYLGINVTTVVKFLGQFYFLYYILKFYFQIDKIEPQVPRISQKPCANNIHHDILLNLFVDTSPWSCFSSIVNDPYTEECPELSSHPHGHSPHHNTPCSIFIDSKNRDISWCVLLVLCLFLLTLYVPEQKSKSEKSSQMLDGPASSSTKDVPTMVNYSEQGMTPFINIKEFVKNLELGMFA